MWQLVDLELPVPHVFTNLITILTWLNLSAVFRRHLHIGAELGWLVGYWCPWWRTVCILVLRYVKSCCCKHALTHTKLTLWQSRDHSINTTKDKTHLIMFLERRQHRQGSCGIYLPRCKRQWVGGHVTYTFTRHTNHAVRKKQGVLIVIDACNLPKFKRRSGHRQVVLTRQCAIKIHNVTSIRVASIN